MIEGFNFETLTIDSGGVVIARIAFQARQFTEHLAGSIPLEMVFIPGGIFVMGSTARYGYEDERPQHPVSVAPFWLGKAPVTQAQWRAVLGKKPACRFAGDDLPVERISWLDAQDFCRRLVKKTRRAYRLPSEAEWEYACRAGTSTPFYCGPTLTTDLANYVGEHIFSGEPRGVYRHTTTEAGTFPPNAYGLYDMHGNLWEWCADAWHENYLGAPADGSAWEGSAWEAGDARYRVVRGGSWHEPPNHCRSAVRLKYDPVERDEVVGFRLALTAL